MSVTNELPKPLALLMEEFPDLFWLDVTDSNLFYARPEKDAEPVSIPLAGYSGNFYMELYLRRIATGFGRLMMAEGHGPSEAAVQLPDGRVVASKPFERTIEALATAVAAANKVVNTKEVLTAKPRLVLPGDPDWR